MAVILSLVLIRFRALQPLSGHALDTGIDKQTSAMLQTVQKFAAQIVSGTRKFDHVTPILNQKYATLLNLESRLDMITFQWI